MRQKWGKYTLAAVLCFAWGCKKPQAVATKPAPESVAGTEGIPNPSPRRRVKEVPVWTETCAILEARVQRIVPSYITEDFNYPITEAIESAFVGTGRFDLVERSRLSQIQDELTRTHDPLWFDQGTVVKMGKFSGARYVVIPSARLEVGVFGTRLDVTIKVLDTETASIVRTFETRTVSNSLSTNSSITSCLGSIRARLIEDISGAYPARATVVSVRPNGFLWAEAKQVQNLQAGTKVRFMQVEEVFNPLQKTSGPFMVEVGRGRIESVESFGLVLRVKSSKIKPEEGWVMEVVQ